MKQIANSNDILPGVFCLSGDGGEVWLDDSWATPNRPWNPGDELVFSLPKPEGQWGKTLYRSPLT